MDADAVEDNAPSAPAARGEESDGEDLLTASYGVVSHKLYDPIKHVGEWLVKDPIDGRQCAKDQIEWLFLKGQMIPRTGVQFPVDCVFGREGSGKSMRFQIVTSDLPSANLPQSLQHDGARTLCYFEWQLPPESAKSFLNLKNRRFYSTRPKYYQAHLMVRFEFDPQTKGLAITPSLLDGTAFPRSRVTFVDPDDLNDGCSVISMPPPMYSLMRPESFASSIFRRFARGGLRDDDETEEAESDLPASETRSGD